MVRVPSLQINYLTRPLIKKTERITVSPNECKSSEDCQTFTFPVVLCRM